MNSEANAQFTRRIGIMLAVVAVWVTSLRPVTAGDLVEDFQSPPAAARPWVFWYWINASVSREGITADLEAMHEAGLGGAYLMPIYGATDPSQFELPAEQLSERWWEMVRHAMREAERLDLEFAMHVCDGFATAGGPWITPELSMQRLVWTETQVAGSQRFDARLPQPEANEGFYRDIAVLAFPSSDDADESTRTVVPNVTTSQPGLDARFLVDAELHGRVRSEEPCWIQYEFAEPFICRSITIWPDGTNYQSQRLAVEASDDGQDFRKVAQLQSPRHGWQNGDAPVTHAIVPTTARFFRFVFDPAGSEPGAEDLDSAKWRPVLKVEQIELSSAPRIHQFEGKNAAVWRVGRRTSNQQVPDELCVPLDQIVDVTEHLSADGRLTWDVPPGRWTILRLGHTSTGHRNETGGAGSGLECDKFNPEAVRLQFDRWYGETIRQVGPELADRVLKGFHVDSWECSSQNWSPGFRDEFRRRRGYDPLPYLPTMAGISVQSADVSERFLHDVRQTIAELVVDVFYDTLAELAHAHGCRFSAECVSPTMTSDGMLHFRAVDVPMSEFWLRSPTHDKPNDMLDAISAAHVYGKPIVQAEAFTELRMAWDEHPAMLKSLADHNYTLGINRMVYHVCAQNPWLDRRPGMTLGAIGLYYQRDQTWWRPGRAWVDYARRCQALLQQGRPAADVAVFTGEQIPRRAVLPESLVSTMPGLVGADVVAREAERLANRGQPQREMPDGVTHSANMADPDDWIDPLHGYAYDSINRDALLRLATVRNGRIELPGGASYALLVLPEPRPLSPEGDLMTPEVANKLQELVDAGATVLVTTRPERSPSLTDYPACEDTVRRIADRLWPTGADQSVAIRQIGAGRVVSGPWHQATLAPLGIERDFEALDAAGRRVNGIAWTHRQTPDADIYFISNQNQDSQAMSVSLRATGRVPELWDPISGEMRRANTWHVEHGRTIVPLRLEASGSIFVVFRETTDSQGQDEGHNGLELQTARTLDGPWRVTFDPRNGGPDEPIVLDRLTDWTDREESGIRYYSGTASYEQTFEWQPGDQRVWLDLGRVENLAEVSVNGQPCGVAWTAPYRIEITDALREGENRLRIDVTNTWANRLIGDHELPEAERITWTTAPYRLAGKPLLDAGLLGPVALLMEATDERPPVIVPPISEADRSITTAQMQQIYDEVKTPFKYGIVLRGGEDELVDCPNVFRFGDKWYMVYVAIKNKIGYETYLAESDDLLAWKPLGKVLAFPKSGWDQWQADGSIALVDPTWGGSAALGKFDGKYWMSYFGGEKQGYETDPLSLGLAWTTTPNQPVEWQRLKENPVLGPNQSDARPFEQATLYKSQILWDKSETLGYPFVMYYNGKQQGRGTERIGMAVSNDLVHWTRYGAGPVIDNGSGISGDPQIVRMFDSPSDLGEGKGEGLWVMFYFGAFWKPGAFDTFACSRDLVHWTKWDGPNLIESSEPWDKTFAHKPWLIKHDGVVYHFYCAVGTEGRAIALATSKDLQAKSDEP
jgi:predicted GH43/DUF377 family glycosyl hydrolase